MASSNSPRLQVTFVAEDVAAIVELDFQAAPVSIAGILEALPIEGEAFHGIYSGSEVASLIPAAIWLPRENTTTRVLPGEIGYYRQRGGKQLGHPDDMAELCWFYDRDAIPSDPDGPVAVNIIGRFTDGWEAFAAVCRAMRTEGGKAVRFDLA